MLLNSFKFVRLNWYLINIFQEQQKVCGLKLSRPEATDHDSSDATQTTDPATAGPDLQQATDSDIFDAGTTAEAADVGEPETSCEPETTSFGHPSECRLHGSKQHWQSGGHQDRKRRMVRVFWTLLAFSIETSNLNKYIAYLKLH